MKIIAFVHHIYQQICKADTTENTEYVLMDIAMQRVANNQQIILFRTDYLE
ncbi:hypothetical protein [Acinetobacter sp. Marseille-Q1623]|uniref:hypothetical protein n=1 Tax=Acinetobacter sp. Marseille-Q1623 TaxID=2697501 RepID=UPI00157B66E3|nr:hypothetical protein [Acinetobacter sp. Marseille-Q1623]